MALARLVFLVLTVAACFAPRLPECALRCGTEEVVCPPAMMCGTDGYCHEEGELQACGPGGADAAFTDGSLADARPGDGPLADARLTDARPDGPMTDAGVVADAKADAPLADAGVTVDASTADRGTPDASSPDAPSCTLACSDERTCGDVGGCLCGDCEFDAEWCGDGCPFAICEENNCCFPENAPCVPGFSQCCTGLTCLLFCVPP